MMSLFKINGLIILNGMGRFRSSAAFRYILLFLIKKNLQTKIFAVQNYSDFRYLQKTLKTDKMHWVPGSGGVKRQIGKYNNCVIVTRPNKYKLQQKSLKSFQEKTIKTNIFCVGVLQNNFKAQPNSAIKYIGRRLQNNIFRTGKTFIQLSGYGEGFPHSLADAMCSKMTIVIEKKEYIKYGLYKILQNNKIKKIKNWYSFQLSNKNSRPVHQECINNELLYMVNILYLKNFKVRRVNAV